jgi:hypothetical protein
MQGLWRRPLRAPWNPHTTVWLLASFLLVRIAECAAGWLLWGGHRSGAVLALALLPFAGVFWWASPCHSDRCSLYRRLPLILLDWRSLR